MITPWSSREIYHFDRLIQKYSSNFEITLAQPQSVELDDLGRPLPSQEPIEPKIVRGAICPPSDREIYQSGGRLTISDRILYYQGDILPPRTKVTFKGKEYSVEGDVDFLDFASFYRYELKGVDFYNGL